MPPLDFHWPHLAPPIKMFWGRHWAKENTRSCRLKWEVWPFQIHFITGHVMLTSISIGMVMCSCSIKTLYRFLVLSLLWSLVISDGEKLPCENKNNPTVYGKIREWQEICKYLVRGSCMSLLTSLMRNQDFPPGLPLNTSDL